MTKVVSGVSVSGDYSRFTDQDFASIAEALVVETLNDNQRQHLQNICDTWGPISKSWEHAARPKKIRCWLKKVQDDSDALLNTLKALHDGDGPDGAARESAIEFLHTAAPGNDWARSLTDLLNIQERVSALWKAAVDAQKCLPEDKGGKTDDWPLKDLIERLKPFFKEVTGEEPTVSFNHHEGPGNEYRTRFFNLVETFLEPLSEYYFLTRNHQGLGKFIERTLLKLKDTTPTK